MAGDGRTRVLGAIRQSLGRGPLCGAARAELAERTRGRHLAEPGRPADPQAVLRRFVEMAEKVSCTVRRLDSAAEVPQAVVDYLRSHNLPQQAVLAPDGWLQGLDWASQPLLERRAGRAEDADLVGVTPAFAAVAETGTLVTHSSAGHPTTLNFLPDHHLVALKASQVVESYEDAWALLRAANAAEGMPRTVNMITGPSRTGDIELTIHLGAHGPRSLHVMLIDDLGEPPGP